MEMHPPCQRISFVSTPFVLVSSKVENPSANQSRKGRKNPEPGTGVPGKESNGNQVPFRGRHSQTCAARASGRVAFWLWCSENMASCVAITWGIIRSCAWPFR